MSSRHDGVGSRCRASISNEPYRVASPATARGRRFCCKGSGSSSGAVNAVSAGHDTPTDTVHLAGVVKAPASAEAKIVSALALCHPNRARVVARAADLVALGLDARAATRRAVMGA